MNIHEHTLLCHVYSYLIGLSPNMAPLYCRAVGTDSGVANSINANLKLKIVGSQLDDPIPCTMDNTMYYTIQVHDSPTYRVGWVSSPAILTYFISPQG